jgi:uncharacterized protein with HEPN domain
VKDDRIYLGHIRDAIRNLRSYASVGETAFLADRMRQDAIIRKLEIIGEWRKPPKADLSGAAVRCYRLGSSSGQRSMA